MSLTTGHTPVQGAKTLYAQAPVSQLRSSMQKSHPGSASHSVIQANQQGADELKDASNRNQVEHSSVLRSFRDFFAPACHFMGVPEPGLHARGRVD